MNTKKLLALITVICLLVCVAIPVAAAPGDRVYPEYNEELMGYELVCDGSTNVIIVPAGEMPNIIMTAGSTVSFYAMDGDGNNGEYTVYFGRSPMDTVLAEEGNATAEFAGGMGCVYNYSEVELTFFITVTEPVGGGEEPAGPEAGTWENPIDMNVAGLGEYVATTHEVVNPMLGFTMTQPTYYKWTAEESGLFALLVDHTNETGWSYVVNNKTTGIYGEQMASTNENDPIIYGVPVTAGDELEIIVGSAYCQAGETVTFWTDFVTECEVITNAMDANGVDLEMGAGSFTVFQVNSMLNGMILSISDDAYITINNVVGAGELTGTPTNIVFVGNLGEADAVYTLSLEYPLGTEDNPISVVVPSDLTSATVDAGSETWYAVSSRLDGYTLTVEGEGAYVIVNGEKVEAVDGVVTVTLEAKGATIPVVIGNASEAEATYECTIEYIDVAPPTGDMIVAALVLMLTSGTALVSLKKKEN